MLNLLGGDVGVSAQRIQGINSTNRYLVVEGMSHIAQAAPSLENRVGDYHSRGVISVYRGATPAVPRSGVPHKRNDAASISYSNYGRMYGKAASSFASIGRSLSSTRSFAPLNTRDEESAR